MRNVEYVVENDFKIGRYGIENCLKSFFSCFCKILFYFFEKKTMYASHNYDTPNGVFKL